MPSARRLPPLAIPLVIAAALVACGDDPVAPDVSGSYAATYAYVATPAGGSPTSGTCTGSLNVTEQAGSGFSGSFRIVLGDCTSVQGVFTGTVQPNGSVVIDGLVDEWLDAEAGALTCTVSGDTALRGTYSASALNVASQVIEVSCDSGDDFSLGVEITATRS